jgi:hypothetical protein
VDTTGLSIEAQATRVVVLARGRGQ